MDSVAEKVITSSCNVYKRKSDTEQQLQTAKNPKQKKGK